MGKSLNYKLKIVFLIALEAIFCFTPLGNIPIGPIVATTAMIPVIVAGLTLGASGGMIVGFFCGLFAFFIWTFIPPNPSLAFIFTPFYRLGDFKGNFRSLIICFVPRILTGYIPAVIKKNSNYFIRVVVASMIGSFTNTVLVTFFVFVFFRNEYGYVLGQQIISIILYSIFINGTLEMVICGIVCPIISKILLKMGFNK